MDRSPALNLAEAIKQHEISRLCHLTPFSNLVHLASGDGLLSLTQLDELNGVYTPNDLERLDGHRDHICCSIEYPNGYYLRQQQAKRTAEALLFPTWVCLIIDPARLHQADTRVCVRNAAAMNGTLIEDLSPQALDALYAGVVTGSRGMTFRRSRIHLAACPTDLQAEVLLARQVPFNAILKVICATESDARRVHAGLEQIGAQTPPAYAVAPTLFDAIPLAASIHTGRRPIETDWNPDDG